MKNVRNFTSGSKKYIKKSYLYFKIFLYLSILYNIHCEDYCKSNNYTYPEELNNIDCFNEIIKFDSKKYRANNFAQNKNGDIILELTELKEDNNNELSSSKLFYGITKEGYPLFKKETSFTHEIQITNDNELLNDNQYDNSINLFISLKNDLNKENEYLFSINSHNLNEDNNIYYIWSFNNFFNLNYDYNESFRLELFEIKEKNEYIIAFLPKFNVTEEIKDLNFIIHFRFVSFDENAYEEINTIKYNNYIYNIIYNVLSLNDYFVVLTLRKDEQNSNERYIYYHYILQFFNYDADFSSPSKEIEFSTSFYPTEDDEKTFFKSIYIENEYVLFFFYPYNYYYNILFELFDLNSIVHENGKDILQSLTSKDEYIANNFDSDKSVNDFIKIDNNKFAFIFISYTNYTSQGISNSEIEYNSICIIILKLKKDPYDFDIKNYKINFGNIIPMIQILGYSYNNFLIFATTNLLYEDNNFHYL